MLCIVQKSVKITKKADNCIIVFFALLVGQLSLPRVSPPPSIYLFIYTFDRTYSITVLL